VNGTFSLIAGKVIRAGLAWPEFIARPKKDALVQKTQELFERAASLQFETSQPQWKVVSNFDPSHGHRHDL